MEQLTGMERMKMRCLLAGLLALLWCAPCMAEPVFAGGTDVGVVRDNNEDSYMIRGDAGVFLVADGMGGHAAGEVASAMAVETIGEFASLPVWGLTDAVLPMSRTMFIAASFFEANRRILAESMANAARRGMGTTAVAIVLRGKYADIINLGDSRAYLIRGGKIVQISHDHSLVQQLIDTGKLKTQEEIDRYPYKNIITQAMGTQPEIAPDLFPVATQPGDIYLLGSDGLTNELTDAEILKIVSDHADLNEAVKLLIDGARNGGGRDNITVVLVRIE